jgi:hypothetical protein
MACQRLDCVDGHEATGALVHDVRTLERRALSSGVGIFRLYAAAQYSVQVRPNTMVLFTNGGNSRKQESTEGGNDRVRPPRRNCLV